MTSLRSGTALRWSLVGLLGLAGLFVVYRRIDLAELQGVLSRAKPGYLLTGAALTWSATLFRSARIAVLLSVRHRLGVLVATFSLMRLLNTALPFRTGELMTIALLKKVGIAKSMADVASSWVLLRSADVFTISVAFAAGLTLGNPGAGVLERYRVVAWLLGAASVGMAVAALAVRPLSDTLRLRGPAAMRRLMERIHLGTERLHDRRRVGATIGLSLPIWALLLSGHTTFQLAFDTPLSLSMAALVSTVVIAVNLLPLQAPLGIGTGDALWFGTLLAMGVAAEEAALLAVAVRLVIMSFVILEGVIGGLVLAALLRRQVVSPDPE